MNLQKSVGSYFPRPLLVILATIVPVAAACYYLSQLRDVHPAAATMSPAAVSARLAPIARVLPESTETKVASGPAGLPSSN